LVALLATTIAFTNINPDVPLHRMAAIQILVAAEKRKSQEMQGALCS
jgi:hypothetical protein